MKKGDEGLKQRMPMWSTDWYGALLMTTSVCKDEPHAK